MEYTLNELVVEWKTRKGLTPLRVDAAVTRHDAFEIDEYAARIIRQWYEELLDTADVALLDVDDITELCSDTNIWSSSERTDSVYLRT